MLGDNIKRIRKSQNISINVLSKDTGISLGYLSDIENNKAINPTTEILNKIADSLKVNVSDLFDSTGDLRISENAINYSVKESSSEYLDDEIRIIARGMQKLKEEKPEDFKKVKDIYKIMSNLADEEFKK